ncbi:MAG: MarC family protein [Lentisphaeria bacterium]|nr:MarC family protein [Lentisphaeria bacterium]
MSTDISSAIAIIIKLFLLLTPFFILSVFVTTCASLDARAQKKLAIRVATAVTVATVVIYLFGALIFKYLGISLDAFRIGAGLVLMLSGIDMVRGGDTPKARDLGEYSSDPAVVPLAIPTTVGPGTIGTLLVMGQGAFDRPLTCIYEVCAIIIASILVGAMLYFGRHLKQLLKDKGLNILSKLTGMYIVALAAQIIFTGAGNMIAAAISAMKG